MARNKEGRPEWFKFWRRNRQLLDIEVLSMESRGLIFTNVMRYFDNGAEDLLEMNPLESMAFNSLKISIDDSFSEYAERQERNQRNGEKGGRPPRITETDTNPENPVGYKKPKKPEDRSKKTEVRRQKSEVSTAAEPPRTQYGEFGWIKLSDDDYNKLLSEMGQSELDRCIRYVDESAQKTGNKNKWKDWFLVVRNCYRYGWGKCHEQSKVDNNPDFSWRQKERDSE